MILINFIGETDIPCNFSIDFIIFQTLNRPVDLLFGPKMTQNSCFWSKLRLKVSNFGSKQF